MTVRRSLLAAVCALVLASPAAAAWRVGVSMTSGTADFAGNLYDPTSRDLRPYTVPETGARLVVQRPLSPRWTAEAGAGWGTYSLRIERPSGACPDLNACDRLEVEHVRATDWSGRLLLLRTSAADGPLSLFAGPGGEFWRGRPAHQLDDGTRVEAPVSTRWSVLVRLGAELPVHRGLRLRSALGQRWGRAHAVYALNQARWWPAGFEAELGLITGSGR